MAHRLKRRNDTQPGVGIVIVGTLFRGPDRFACYRDRLIAIPPELHGGQTIKFQNELFLPCSRRSLAS